MEASLKESEQIFRSIVENSHAGIFVTDNKYCFTYANDILCEIFGYPRNEVIGLDFRILLDEESKKQVIDRYLRRQRGEAVPSRYEFSIIRKDGQKRRVELSSAVIQNTLGEPETVGQLLDITERTNAEAALRKAHEELESRVTERTSDLLEANASLKKEITQREQAQEALRRSELKYRHLIQSANTIILEMDPEGRVIFINQFAEGFFGFSESEILGKSVVGTIVPSTDSAGRDLKTMINDIVAHPEHYLHNENENMLHNGERVWIVWTNQPLYDENGQLREILCIGIDRTEQKRGEEINARQAREKAAAEERNRLARDLHDAVSQTLFSASIIAEVLPRLWEKNPDEGLQRLEEIRQLTRGALAEMRTLLLELRPSALIDAELSDLLRQLTESITGRARIPVSLEVKGHSEQAPEVKVALYRIAQEALNNVAKHSGASQARVSLFCDAEQAELTVSDNGKGFDLDSVSSGSLGLGIIRERAKTLGARVTIHSRKGQGTAVKVNWRKAEEEKQ